MKGEDGYGLLDQQGKKLSTIETLPDGKRAQRPLRSHLLKGPLESDKDNRLRRSTDRVFTHGAPMRSQLFASFWEGISVNSISLPSMAMTTT
jgi:hypothetical protein